MIGRLRGMVAEVGMVDALIDVGGVGYIVQCGSRTLARLLPDSTATLYIESYTREDGTRLFGFLDRDDRAAFQHLQTIQGVGPKAALALLDALTPHELSRAAAFDDVAAISRANGIGPKLAARIATELKTKPLSAPSGLVTGGVMLSAGPTQLSEAVATLMALGVSEHQARRDAQTALSALGAEAEVQALVKHALKAIRA